MAEPFEQHLRDAIALNRTRAPSYAALGGDSARSISRRLILAERLLLPVAWAFDRWARRYHEAGIPLLTDVFEPINRVPPFRAYQAAPPEQPRIRTSARGLRGAVQRAWRTEGFAGASRVLNHIRLSLAAQPCFNCMVRHLTESALRVAHVAERHIRLASKAGLPSPCLLYSLLLRMHLWGFGLAARLDDAAAPLQAAGLPILCQDVPAISPYPASFLPDVRSMG